MSLPVAREGAADFHTWPSIGYGTLPLRRLLVVQTQRLGDVLCATPLFGALRRQFPRAHLAALVHHPHQVVLEASPDLDEVLTYDRQSTHRSLVARLRFVGELRARAFDWAIVIHAAGSVAFALWQAGIPWRTCVWRYGDCRKPHWATKYHQHVRQDRLAPGKHEIEHNLDVLRELGMTPEPSAYRLCVRAEERCWAEAWLREAGREPGRRLAVLHPGHGGGRQEWPAASYARVADGLRKRGFQVALTGSPGERQRAEQIAAESEGPVLNLAGKLTLRQLMAVLEGAGLFVSVPTGPMHLASALKVPAVTLYGPSDLAIDHTRFCPYGSPFRAVVSPLPCPCPGHRLCRDPVCMPAITPEAVLAATDELSASPEERAGTAPS